MRRRLFWAIVAFGFGAGSTWWFREDIFRWLIAPADESLSPFDAGLPIFTAPTDMLGVTIRLAIYGGIITALPVLIVGIYTLVSPALSSSQRSTLKLFLPVFVLLFLTGVAFVYYVMLPTGLHFLLHFGDNIAIPLITIKQYLDLLTQLMFALGIVFELPLVMFLSAKMRLLSYQRFRSLRKFVPFAAVILGTIITPGTDPLNMAIVAVPIIVLYEVGLFLAWLAHPEDADYMAVKKMRSCILWLKHLPCRIARKAVALATAPFRKLWRLVRRVR